MRGNKMNHKKDKVRQYTVKITVNGLLNINNREYGVIIKTKDLYIIDDYLKTKLWTCETGNFPGYHTINKPYASLSKEIDNIMVVMYTTWKDKLRIRRAIVQELRKLINKYSWIQHSKSHIKDIKL